MEDKQSKVILYTYDSFLIDYAVEDGKEVLKEIKRLLEINGFVVKVAYGPNYNSLKYIFNMKLNFNYRLSSKKTKLRHAN